MAFMVSSPNRLDMKFIPPRAAIIWGSTMNILKMPMKTPILFGSTELDNMAYGIDSILPQANPISVKQSERYSGEGIKYIKINPAPPKKRETRCTHFLLMILSEVYTTRSKAKAMEDRP